MPKNYLAQSKVDMEFQFLNSSALNRAEYLRLCSICTDISEEAGVLLAPGYRLVRTVLDGSNFLLALLCDTAQEIVYYIRCELRGDLHLNAKPVTQVFLWRTSVHSHVRATTGVAGEVFFQYLVGRYTLVASDSYHTAPGREFWVRQTSRALGSGMFVYRYDRLLCALTRVVDHEVIRTNSADIWGDTDTYLNVLLVLSSEELPTK